MNLRRAIVAAAVVPLIAAVARADRVDDLVKVMRSGDYYAKIKAAKELGRSGDPRAAPVLIREVEVGGAGGMDRAVNASIQALGWLREPRAVPAIVARMDRIGRWHWSVKLGVEALRQIGGPAAVSALIDELLAPAPASHTRLVAKTLNGMGAREEAVKRLTETIRGPDEVRTIKALKTLAVLPGPDIKDALLRAVTDARWTVRLAAMTELVRQRHGEGLEIAERWLADETEVREMRIVSAEVLARTGGRAPTPLVKALTDDDREVALAAIQAVGRSRDVSVAPVLTGMLASPDLDRRAAAAWALSRGGAKDLPSQASIRTIDLPLSPDADLKTGVPLLVREPVGVARDGLTAGGVPLPKGAVRDARHLRVLNAENEVVPAQCRRLVPWPDGSTRFALVEFPVRIGPFEQQRFTLALGEKAEQAATPLRVRKTDRAIQVETGALRFRVNTKRFNVFDGVWVGERQVVDGGRSDGLVMYGTPSVRWVHRPKPPGKRRSSVVGVSITAHGNCPEETWTITAIDGEHYRLTGSKTGDDGTGTRFKQFVSKSGNIIIKPYGTLEYHPFTPGEVATFQTVRGTKGQGFTSRRGKVIEAAVEEAGPHRACVKVRGTFAAADGTELNAGRIRYTARIHARARSTGVRVLITLENDGLYGGHADNRPPQPLHFDSCSLQMAPVTDRPMRVRTARTETRVDTGERWMLKQIRRGVNGSDVLQNFLWTASHNGGEVGQGGRWTGWVTVAGPRGRLTLALRQPWQNYPKSVYVDDTGLWVGLWPDFGAWPSGATGQYFYRGGRHKTHELAFDFDGADGEGAAALVASLDHPLVVQSPPEWIARTGAWPMFAPSFHVLPEAVRGRLPADLQKAWPAFERTQRAKVHIEDTSGADTDRSIPDLRRTQSGPNYGWIHFGDLFWAEGVSSLHYDWPYSMLLHFLRTGDRAFFRIGREMAEHRRDVDQYHASGGSNWIRYLQWYEKGNAWTHGVLTPKPTHTWVQGMLLHYLVTGDRRSLEMVLQCVKGVEGYWFKQMGIGKGPRREAGEYRSQGWSIENLVAAWLATAEKSYLEKAMTIAKNGLIAPDVRAGSTGFFEPEKKGAYCLMQGYVQTPLIELHYETKDPDVLALIQRINAWTHRAAQNGRVVGGKYRPLAFSYHWSPTAKPKQLDSGVYTWLFPNGLAYGFLQGGRADRPAGRQADLDFARQMFRDAVLYQNPGYTMRSRAFPGSETKVHGWTGRFNQTYLWTEWRLAGGSTQHSALSHQQ